MEIRRIHSREIEFIDDIVSIHTKTFDNFFLTFLGEGFLSKMYRAYASHTQSGIYIALEKDSVIGFLAYSEDLSGLYKYMLKRSLIPFVWYSFCAFLRKPKIFFRLFRALLKPSEAKRVEPYVELSSIGVLPGKKSIGVGSGLIKALVNDTDFAKYEYITLETDAIDNDGPNHFYVKNGFCKVRSFETKEGRLMYEYRLSPSLSQNTLINV